MHCPSLVPTPDSVPELHRQSLKFTLDGGEVDFSGHIIHDVEAENVNEERISLHIELPAKLLDYFLRSNKSNINQCCLCLYCIHTEMNNDKI